MKRKKEEEERKQTETGDGGYHQPNQSDVLLLQSFQWNEPIKVNLMKIRLPFTFSDNVCKTSSFFLLVGL